MIPMTAGPTSREPGTAGLILRPWHGVPRRRESSVSKLQRILVAAASICASCSTAALAFAQPPRANPATISAAQVLDRAGEALGRPAAVPSAMERLDAMLRKAKRLTVSEKMGDVLSSDCYVLRGDTGSGAIMFWIDPEHGYNAAKVETVIRSGNPAYNDKITTTTKLENVLFKKIDGVWIPMEADSLKQVDYDIRGKNGYTHEQSHHKRTQFLLNPDHNALGSFSDPFKSDPHLLDETTVYKPGDTRAYIWRGGKVVLDEKLQRRR